jgi:cytochrome b6-f complex iron-sulfur subunit
MADQTQTAAGVLGGLPPWPRKPLNNSVISAEQAYRKRKGLPLLSDADIEALKAGQPMSWESGDGASASAPAVPAPTIAAQTPPSSPQPEPGASATPSATGVGMSGVAGGLPPLPRKALNNSVISAEQAYRNKKGLPLLTDAEIECLKAGVPMPWEPGGQMPAAAAGPTPPPATAATPAAAPPTAANAPVAATGPMSGIAGGLPALPRKALNNSVISAEQAYRKRKGLPLLSDVEIECLRAGLPMPWEAGGQMPTTTSAPAAVPAAAPAARPAAAAAAPAPARPAAPSGPPLTRTGPATKYVGTPAVGTSQAAAAGGVAAVGPTDTSLDRMRRRLVWSCVAAFLVTWLIAFFRFFLPRTLFEPSTVFKIGYPSDYALGVDTKFQQKYRIWVDRTPDRLFVIYARCTHLGCTPDWKPAENKFKCPCHGSGYDSEGINFEGPAPRPMDRAHVEIDPEGQIVVDTSRLYQQPKGQRSQFNDSGAYLNV